MLLTTTIISIDIFVIDRAFEDED